MAQIQRIDKGVFNRSTRPIKGGTIMIVSVFRHVRTPGSNGEEQTEMEGGCGLGRT